MRKIIIFGSLPSGQGGMETVFRKFYFLFNKENSDFNVKLFMYSLNDGNNLEWVEGLNPTIYNPNSKFRYLQKHKIANEFSDYLKNNEVNFILAYDPLGVFLARKAIKKSRKKVLLISWIHFSIAIFKEKYQNYLLDADYHFTLCDELKSQIASLNIPEKNIFIIFNPVSQKKGAIKRTGEMSLLYLGRVQYEEQKNLRELFYALSNMTQFFTLNIVGDGERSEREKLLELSKSLKIEQNIIWHGWKSDPWDYICNNLSIDVLVMSSKYEGFPMTLCEAISYGVFCISSDCPTGPKDIINADNGILYPQGNINKLKEALIQSTNQNLSPETIKESISYLYDENYYVRIKNIFFSLA